MTTYSSLKYNHPFSSNATGTGSLTLISSQTASASASISFTTGIDSTYDEYVFKFINIHPSVQEHFTFNFSTDGGSNYNVTKTSTLFRAYHDEADTATGLVYETSADLAQSTSYQFLEYGRTGSSDSRDSVSGYMQLFNPSDTTYVKHFIGVLNNRFDEASIYSIQNYVAGYGNTTSAINAIDFKFESGNIDDGTILMYGVK
jgi:hypothetical protein